MNEYRETGRRVENLDDQTKIFLLEDKFRVRRMQTTSARYVVLFAAAEGFAWQLLGVFRLLPWMAQGHGVLDVNE